MSDQIKVGDVAYLKSTSEPVMVLGSGLGALITKDGEESFNYFLVRRPVNTRDGITHVEERFRIFELETYKEKVDREVAELQYGRDLVMATKAGHVPQNKELTN